jgi:hypothetical protein
MKVASDVVPDCGKRGDRRYARFVAVTDAGRSERPLSARSRRWLHCLLQE